jgi:hypothetical protein
MQVSGSISTYVRSTSFCCCYKSDSIFRRKCGRRFKTHFLQQVLSLDQVQFIISRRSACSTCLLRINIRVRVRVRVTSYRVRVHLLLEGFRVNLPFSSHVFISPARVTALPAVKCCRRAPKFYNRNNNNNKVL